MSRFSARFCFRVLKAAVLLPLPLPLSLPARGSICRADTGQACMRHAYTLSSYMTAAKVTSGSATLSVNGALTSRSTSLAGRRRASDGG